MVTDAQRRLIVEMGFRPNVLCNGDESSPMWWLDGGGAVKANVAKALIKKGFVRLTKHEGGHPGLLCFTVTEAGGRAARADRGAPLTK